MEKKIIGFGTGFLYKTHSRISAETVKLCKEIGCNAIELNPHDDAEFFLLDKLKKKDLAGFDFISLHAPEKLEKAILDQIQLLHNRFGFDAITIHASDLARHQEILKTYGMPFSIENVDNRKENGRTLEEMKSIMAGSDYGVVLDINHAYINDPTLQLADSLWEEFKGRISHFHLSGYKGFHDPLIETHQTEFINFVKDKNKPIIIESVLETPAEAKEEFDYIIKFLK